jgi:hypothetical protein
MKQQDTIELEKERSHIIVEILDMFLTQYYQKLLLKKQPVMDGY